MTTTTFTVLINGPLPPRPVQVSLIQNGKHIADFSTLKTLIRPFDNLPPGNYDMFINGANIHGGAATFTLTTNNIILHPPDNTPTTKTEPNYLVTFHFTVKTPS